MAATPTLTGKDNGYFELWTLPCGHVVRVGTEDQQWIRRDRVARARMHLATRTRLATATCPDCPAAPKVGA